MRVGRVALVVLLLAALSSSGCGTIMNLARSKHERTPFGGTWLAVRAVALPVTGTLPGQSLVMRWLHLPLGLIDLPFSILGDVFTLPWALGGYDDDGQRATDL